MESAEGSFAVPERGGVRGGAEPVEERVACDVVVLGGVREVQGEVRRPEQEEG